MEQQSFNFEITLPHLNVIVQALGNAPYNVAAPVLNVLQAQVKAQQSVPPLPAPPVGPANVEEANVG